MGDKKIYIIAKVFDKHGCYAYQCKSPKELMYVPGALELLRNEGVQIVILDNPEIYSEYAPYNYISKRSEFVEKVISLNQVEATYEEAPVYAK